MARYRAPATCPVCSRQLITLRVGCAECGTELSGHFEQCRFCRLDAADLALLVEFLRSRGNLRDVQSYLGVSYPTARQRLNELLERLALGESHGDQPPPGAAPAAGRDTAGVLTRLAAGEIGVDEAQTALTEPRPAPRL
ncbi:MAG: DUF2089 domain-containing protein [Candidatus Nanopelagicales bacterium]